MTDTPPARHPDDARHRLLARIDDGSQSPADTAALLDILGLPAGDDEAEEALGNVLDTLMRQGRIVPRADGSWRTTRKADVVGRMTVPKHGQFALVLPVGGGPPVTVASRAMKQARHGDLVHAAVLADDVGPASFDRDGQPRSKPKRGRGRHRRDDGGNGHDDGLRAATVVQVLRERPSEVIGIVEARDRDRLMIRVLRRDAPKLLRITGESPAGTRHGAIVRVRVERDADSRKREQGRVLEILGSALSPEDDELVAIAEFGLKMDYDPAAEQESRDLVALLEQEERQHQPDREDLTHLKVITIDPDDARDFDDAISVEHHEDGTVTLGVHIADVSHYVRPGMAMDTEARERGCTVYFPQRTLHMLPGELARNVCSLSPDRRRMAKTVFMRFDQSGAVLHRRLVRSEILSGQRLTYGQARAMLRDEMAADELAQFPDWVPGVVRECRRVADILHTSRRQAGSFQLDIEKPHLVLGEGGRFERVEPEKQDESHNLVEECMLQANQAVARFLYEAELPLIARIHPEPSEADTEAFATFLAELGYEIPGGRFTPVAIQSLLDEIAGKPGGAAVHLALLKSMQRAIYAPEPGLHYALQFEFYSHFTSPIRRYPDLMVHQIIDAYIEEGGRFEWTGDGLPPARTGLAPDVQTRFELAAPTVAQHCTEMGIRADQAGFRVIRTRILRELEASHLGARMTGTIMGGTNNGLFCQLDNWLVEGYLGRHGLGADRLDKQGPFAHVGWYGMYAHEFKVGDRVKVILDDIDPVLGHCELQLAEAPWEGTGRGPRKVGRVRSDEQERGHRARRGGKVKPRGGKPRHGGRRGGGGGGKGKGKKGKRH